MNYSALSLQDGVVSAPSIADLALRRKTEATATTGIFQRDSVSGCGVDMPLGLPELNKTHNGTEVAAEYWHVGTHAGIEVKVSEYEHVLEKLAGLEDNWDGYGAAPPNDRAILLAKKIVSCLAEVGLRPSRVNPSVEEGVCISFQRGQVYADLESYNSGEVVAAISDRKGKDQVWEVDPTDHGIGQAVRLIRDRLRNCSR